jgi:hypothetical protein
MTNHPVSKKAGLSQSKVTEGAMQASTRVVQQAAAAPMLGAARVGRAKAGERPRRLAADDYSAPPPPPARRNLCRRPRPQYITLANFIGKHL